MADVQSAPTRNDAQIDRAPRERARPEVSAPVAKSAPRFHSILFSGSDDIASESALEAPECFRDLNLDQIVEAVTASWAEYDLKPFFHAPLTSIDAIQYRHEVFRDLEDPVLLAHILSFADGMRAARSHLALINKFYYPQHKQAWLLHAAETYCRSIKGLASDLASARPGSRGLRAFRDYLTGYAAGSAFVALAEEAEALAADLSKVRYCVHVHDGGFTVRDYEGEPDYSADVEATFQRFKTGAAKDYKVKYRFAPEEMNHIEAKILEFVALLNPAVYARLADYCTRHQDFIDGTIARFDREVHFYIAYLQHAAKFKSADLPFCYPAVRDDSKEVYDYDGFDLALAQKLVDADKPIVVNDFHLQSRERVIVVTGPNQGGKTTFARAFGQLHYLASLGCPVPGTEAQLFLFDRLFTHFERQEKVESLRGKLEDDLERIHAILERATPRSILVMNEIFTSTTLEDEIVLGRCVMEKLAALDILAVWVTFVDELASLNEQTVSMVGSVAPDNPTERTFKIVRRPADGLAHAVALAEKYRVTYDRIRGRMRS